MKGKETVDAVRKCLESLLVSSDVGVVLGKIRPHGSRFGREE